MIIYGNYEQNFNKERSNIRFLMSFLMNYLNYGVLKQQLTVLITGKIRQDACHLLMRLNQ